MNKKICIITGANSGIGKEAVEQLALEGFHVIMACRNAERGEAALTEIKERNPSSSIELMIVDMGQMASVKKMAETYTYLAANERLVKVTGKYFNENNTEGNSNKYTNDKNNITSVMKLTRTYIPQIGDV